jgi:hypothetical protein
MGVMIGLMAMGSPRVWWLAGRSGNFCQVLYHFVRLFARFPRRVDNHIGRVQFIVPAVGDHPAAIDIGKDRSGHPAL